MLTASETAELSRALEALETVIALRLEERRSHRVHDPDPAARIEALVSRRVTIQHDELLPPLATWEGDGPLAQVVTGCALSPAEALAVTAALAVEVDERVAALFGLLSDRPGVTGLTGEVVRTLCARTLTGRLAAGELLAGHQRLRGSRLLRLEPSPDGPLAGRVSADPDLVAFALGRIRESAAHDASFPATPLRTVHVLDDLVVTSAVRERLAALVGRIRHRRRVLRDWGFATAHDGVEGTVALFHGPPGTGKTMAAAVIARAAGLPGYRIDLSALVSKYIGETEKNLARVFERAEAEDCVLFFDEADAVFGRRGEVSDARDRYANQEVSYLLQRVEEHPGVVILATNLRGNLDNAFSRRIGLHIEFSEPGPPERRRLWRRVLPAATPVAGELRLEELAERFPMTGAQIRDAALEAAYLAADNGQAVTREYVLRAIRSQFDKLGRSVPAAR